VTPTESPLPVLEPGSAAIGEALLARVAELERRLVAKVAGLPRFSGGAVGYLAYDVVSQFEPSVPVPAAVPLGLPDAIFCFSDALLIFDDVRDRARLVALEYAISTVSGRGEGAVYRPAPTRRDPPGKTTRITPESGSA